MKDIDIGDTSREHVTLRAGLKAGESRPPYRRGIAPPIPILHFSETPWTLVGEGSLHVGGPEAEAERMSVNSDDIANHDFPIPPLSPHRTEGRVTEETGKLEEECVHRGGEIGTRKGDRQAVGYAPTIMDQNKLFASNDGDVEPRNDV